jgi:molybdenum cofactor biosynthesis enzyme MoaA
MAVNINLELTDHCNLKCGMCSQSMRDEAHGVPMRFMAWETWRRSLRNLRDFEDEISLCPHWLGEPTIHPQFDRFVEYAFAANQGNVLFRHFKLHTNAVVFGEDRSRLLLRLANLPSQKEDTFQSIHFSIDAYSRDSYERVKGADKREQVFRNVERFLELRNELGLRRPTATMAFVVQDGNADEAGDYLRHWRQKLENLGRDYQVTTEWPDQNQDSIYFRRLNSGSQLDADRLHADTAGRIGIEAVRIGRAPESF